MKIQRVLISGASIAGPALGYWLQRYGFDVTIVETSPSLRKGGYKIDVRGIAVEVLKKMELYTEAYKHKIVMQGGTFLDEKGLTVHEIPPEHMGMHVGDDIELWREDLAKVLYDATSNSCEYIFNNSIKSIKSNLLVEFTRGDSRQFDLLIGADGIHSNVRSLVFGEESLYSHNLGDYFVAICSIETELQLDHHEMFYSKKDMLLNLYCVPGQKAKALFVFRAPGLTYDYKDVKQQKEIVSSIYRDAEWETPNILKSMNLASEFYFDEVKQIRMDKWFKDRVIVIGDAAYSPCLASGQGTSMALVGAYLLAGELFLANGDYAAAFPKYEKAMRPFVDMNQRLGEAIIEHMIPKGKVEPWLGDSILDQIQSAANCIPLKEYP
ncbi:MAG: FAD-dependent monooxygenase [Verrucomicrobia bacterium]|nr:FAD-dependent monooxygenase [Verrucomicrobiota bacterium]